MVESVAFVECQCGKCRITFCDPKVRCRSECLCVDCRQRLLQFENRNPDYTLPPDVRSYERGTDDYFFTNRLKVDDNSRDLLVFTKLREDAPHVSAMSACCGTPLCGDHPLFNNASVAACADSCNITISEDVSSRAVWFGCDFPPDKYAPLIKNRSVPAFFSPLDEMDREEIVAFMKVLTEPPAQKCGQGGCVSFEQLRAQKAVKVDNSFFEESRRGCVGAGS